MLAQDESEGNDDEAQEDGQHEGDGAPLTAYKGPTHLEGRFYLYLSR